MTAKFYLLFQRKTQLRMNENKFLNNLCASKHLVSFYTSHDYRLGNIT